MSLITDMPRPCANSRSTPPSSPGASTISDSNSLEVEYAEMAFATRFITAVETLVGNKLSNSNPDGTEKPKTKGGQPHIGRGTILGYKHVEEAWDDKAFKYKIVEDDQSSVENLDEIFRELVENGQRFISLHGSHHLQYRGFAFFFDDEGEIVKRHVNGRIIVDAVGFREHNPGHPQPTVRNVNPIQETSGPCNWTGSFSSEIVVLQDEDFLICGPTILGFCLGSKKFLEFAVTHIGVITWIPSSYDDVKVPDAQKKAI